MNTSKKLGTLDRLVSDEVSADALKLALEQHKKKQQERDAQRVTDLLEAYDRSVNKHVANIRAARKVEKDAKAKIDKLEAALEAFKEDGNIDTFYATVGMS